MCEHLELKRTDRGKNGVGIAEVWVAQHLHDTFFVELRQALAELLELARVEGSGRCEHFGLEARYARELDCGPGIEGVAYAQVGGVDETDDVARVSRFDCLAIAAEGGRGVLGADEALGARARRIHASLELARTDAREGKSVAVVRVHVGLHLENERSKRFIERARRVVHVGARQRGRCEVDHRVEQHPDTEVGERRTDEYGGGPPGEERIHVEVGTDGVEKRTPVDRRGPRGTFSRCSLVGGNGFLW